MSFISGVNSFLSGVSQTANDINSLKNSYNTLKNTIGSATGGLIQLPNVPSELNNIFRVGQHAETILGILGLTQNSIAGVGSHTVVSSSDVASGSFKWVEMETTPESFATPDSVLLFAGDPLYSNMQMGAELVPIGLCQGFTFSSGINVTVFKELRCEETIIIPGKSQPGSMNISRICGAYSSLANRLHIQPNWNYSTQSATTKQLFGVMAMYLTPSRSNTISTLYFERCAITNISSGFNAGDIQVLDNVNIIYGRCLTVGALTQSATLSTSNSTQTDTDTSNGSVVFSSSDSDKWYYQDPVQNVPEGYTEVFNSSTGWNTD